MLPSNLRVVLRDLKRRPTFAAAVILTLGIGIGATTAAFAFVRSVFFAQLPVRDQARVVVLWAFNHDVSMYPRWPLTWESRLLVADHSRSFAEVAAVASYTGSRSVRYGDRTFPVARTLVDGNFFDVLGSYLSLGVYRLCGDQSGRVPLSRTVLFDAGYGRLS
jgi:hypothetical protein